MEERILQFEQRLDALEDSVAEMNIHIAEKCRLVTTIRVDVLIALRECTRLR